MPTSDFDRITSQVHFPELDAEVSAMWKRIDAFGESIRSRPADREYTFYDGPPFTTGRPHYGHILAGVIKDIVPRYWTMRGYRIERRFGWDTHGLPIEMEVQGQLGISGPHEIAELGVDKFNEACRAMVERTTEEWEEVTDRIGRWVDFRNDYKTMDPGFMESVWWVFKQLWDKGLVYQDFKVLPYSWACATPLSNFELNLGGYRDVDDPSITVRLKVIQGRGPVKTGDYLLIWTTTPWTLPGNLAVAVEPDLQYAAIPHDGDRHWVLEELAGSVWDDPPAPLARASGKDMVGSRYEPAFPYFEHLGAEGGFVVVPSPDVTAEEGTGLVHMAPAYGESDFDTFAANDLSLMVDPIDGGGRFTDQVPEVAGQNVKDADRTLVRLLKESGKLVRHERIVHSYPFCYRTDTPLMYKAIPTWFVKVSQLRDRLVKHNRSIHWVPGYVGERRFGNWLSDARDWAISRNRYWGSCIPVWECHVCRHQHCMGSLDELEQHSGQRPTDLHKHVVDLITFPCPLNGCGGTMRRVPEVLDCWFESGSMPYGQQHYPFENRQRFEDNFPAHFIAEGLDQTRGWFYTLHILAAALFDRPAFSNCVVNGMILASDGRKMSKRLKNYPEPLTVLDKFGADALRAYLINSPVLRAEPLRFSEAGVKEVVRTVLLPLWNTFSFFTTYAEADGIGISDIAAAPPPDQRPSLDRWILSMLQSLITEVRLQMDGYYLYAVVPPTLGFIDHLTNWYVRRSRRRFWRSRGEDDADKLAAFATLYEVLVTFSEVLAPVLPFITEKIYQSLVSSCGTYAPASIHLRQFPEPQPERIDPELEEGMDLARKVVRLTHGLRKQHNLRVRQPLSSLTVNLAEGIRTDPLQMLSELVTSELNVRSIEVVSGEKSIVELSAKADFRRLGPRLGPRTPEVAQGIEELSKDQIQDLLDGGTLGVAGIPISGEDIVVHRRAPEGTAIAVEDDLTVTLDVNLTEALRTEGVAREITARLQQLRRERKLAVTDRVAVIWASEHPSVIAAMRTHGEMIASEVLASVWEEGSGEIRLQVGTYPLSVSLSTLPQAATSDPG
ncbi:MAG: isoleucine--tRNA ligase [Actinomycetia bacterium]|nr:isoleucine--tRNA ligase [Actinomycetes bacterium]